MVAKIRRLRSKFLLGGILTSIAMNRRLAFGL
jgi:hypothetical protein